MQIGVNLTDGVSWVNESRHFNENITKIISPYFYKRLSLEEVNLHVRNFDFWRPDECGFISLTIIGKLSKCLQDSTFLAIKFSLNLSLAKRVNLIPI